jgi:hypothetical protein
LYQRITEVDAKLLELSNYVETHYVNKWGDVYFGDEFEVRPPNFDDDDPTGENGS